MEKDAVKLIMIFYFVLGFMAVLTLLNRASVSFTGMAVSSGDGAASVPPVFFIGGMVLFVAFLLLGVVGYRVLLGEEEGKR
jgi:hypothetical protein